MGMPDHAPLLAGNVVCFTCGTILKPYVVMGRRGVDHIEYECKNPSTGCSYKVESNHMISAEMKGLRTDGSEVNLDRRK